MDQIAAALRSHPEILTVEIQGHTDDQGDDQYNAILSQRRAESVQAGLVQRSVDAARLRARGYGELRPLVLATTDEARARNRRVEFRIWSAQNERFAEAWFDALRGRDRSAPERRRRRGALPCALHANAARGPYGVRPRRRRAALPHLLWPLSWRRRRRIRRRRRQRAGQPRLPGQRERRVPARGHRRGSPGYGHGGVRRRSWRPACRRRGRALGSPHSRMAARAERGDERRTHRG